MSKTKTFTISVTAVNTATAVTGQGSLTPIATIPGTGPNKIKRVSFAVGADFLALGNAVSFCRIGGGGIKNGEQQIIMGGHGGQIVTTAQSAIIPWAIGNGLPDNSFGDLDIECTGGGELILQAEMAETDIGSIGVGITLEFEHD